jgi:hypothetical protein
MAPTIHLDFDPYNADHRRVAEWLVAQSDPAEAIVRLVRAAGAGEQRLQRWEELAAQLAGEVRRVRTQLGGQPPETGAQAGIEPETVEDPESARRLDSMFEQGAR